MTGTHCCPSITRVVTRTRDRVRYTFIGSLNVTVANETRFVFGRLWCFYVCCNSVVYCDLILRDLRLPPQSKWVLPSYGLLRDVRWFEPTFRNYLYVPSSRVKLSKKLYP
jgi:hypothetical protein